MSAVEGSRTDREVVIAPDPSRSKYDIAIPWLTRGKRTNPRALENLDVDSLRILFDTPTLMDSGQHTASAGGNGCIVESDWSETLHQGLPSDMVVTDIAESIGKYIGINGSDNCVSDVVRKYLERRCFGRQMMLDNNPDIVDLIKMKLRPYIAQYLSYEIMQVTYDPKCVNISLSSTTPFKWTHDMPLMRANKTVFNYVATLDQYEREFASFLDRSADVMSFTSLGVTARYSLVFQGNKRHDSSALLPYDPDWAVVHHYNGEVWNWIVGTKHYSGEDVFTNEFMTTEWCNIATQVTGTTWHYMLIDPHTDFGRVPSFQALVVDNVLSFLDTLASTQRVPTSLKDILDMRDEGRRW